MRVGVCVCVCEIVAAEPPNQMKFSTAPAKDRDGGGGKRVGGARRTA